MISIIYLRAPTWATLVEQPQAKLASLPRALRFCLQGIAEAFSDALLLVARLTCDNLLSQILFKASFNS
jgi:hypothetical protein